MSGNGHGAGTAGNGAAGNGHAARHRVRRR